MSNAFTAGFLNTIDRQLTGGGGANSVLGFVDSGRDRRLRREQHQDMMGVVKTEQAQAGALNNAQVAQLEAKTAADMEELRQSGVQFDNQQQLFTAQQMRSVYNGVVAMGAAKGLDTKAPDFFQQAIQHPEINSFAAAGIQATPHFQSAVARDTGLDPSTVQARPIEGRAGDLALVGTSTRNGQPAPVTNAGDTFADNPQPGNITTIQGQDIAALLQSQAALSGGAMFESFQALDQSIANSRARGIDTGTRQTPTATPIQAFTANTGTIDDAALDAATGNVGLTATSGGFQRNRVLNEEGTDRAMRYNTSVTGDYMARDAADSANRINEADETALRNEIYRQIQNPYWRSETDTGEVTRRIDAQEAMATDAAFKVVQSLGEDSAGDLGFFDTNTVFEEFRTSQDPATNRANILSSLTAAMRDPSQIKKVQQNGKLNFPKDRNNWNERHWQAFAQIAALSARRSENRLGRDVKVRGKITQGGIDDYIKGMSPQQEAGFLSNRRNAFFSSGSTLSN